MKLCTGYYSPTQLRWELQQRLLQDYQGQLKRYPLAPQPLFEYMCRQTLSMQLQWQTYAGHLQDFEIQLLCDLMTEDWARVNSYAAVVAWLTTDEFRWHQVVLHDRRWRQQPYAANYQIPQDLSYGLVLQYPEGILRTAAYLLGYITDEDVRQYVGDEAYRKCQDLVLQALETRLTPAQLRTLLVTRNE